MKYYKRGFLNKDEGMAAFAASVYIEDGERKYGYVNADFTISDCNRQVCLDFCISEKKDIQEASNKVQNLINELQQFKEQLALAADVFINIENKRVETNAKL